MADDELDIRIKSINERAEHLREDSAQMEAAASNMESELAMLDNFMAMARGMSSRLDTMDNEGRSEVINALVTKINIGASIDIEMALGLQSVTNDMVACSANLQPT